MINNMPYEEILTLSTELKNCCEEIRNLIQGKDISQLEDFISSVDVYYKYLENVVELNISADEVLKDIIK